MKKLLSNHRVQALSAIFLSILLIAAGVNLINNGKLTTDLDANSKALINVKTQSPHDIWVTANRSDGKGKGTQIDPLDASTAANLKTIILNAAASTPITVHLVAGAYQLPYMDVTASNLKIKGAGMFQTVLTNSNVNPAGCGTPSNTIQCVGNTDYRCGYGDGFCHPRFAYWYFYGDGNEVSDLQIDENTAIHTDQTETVGAIRMYGSNNLIHCLYANHPRGINTVAEAFPIGMATNGGVPSSNNVIEYSIVGNFTGNYGTMIGFGGDDGGAPGIVLTGGRLTGNYIFNCPATAGLGLGGTRGVIIESNTVDGSNSGFNHDSWEVSGLSMRGNSFLHCHQYGLINRTFENAATPILSNTIEDNFIELTGERNDSTGIADVDNTYHATDTIRNNTVMMMHFTGTTNGTNTVSNIPAAEFAYLVVNHTLVAADITSGTYITSINSGAHTVSLSASATGSHTNEIIRVMPQTSSTPKSYDIQGGAGWIVSGNKEQAGFLHNITNIGGATITNNIADDGTNWTENREHTNYQASVNSTIGGFTAYTMTNSDALIHFTGLGSSDPTITIAQSGTYMLYSRALLSYQGATYSSNQTAKIKLRRTNNTALDVSGAVSVATLRVLTTTTDSAGAMVLPPTLYVAGAGDTISVYGSVSAAPSAGSVQATEASVTAIRLY